MGAEALAARLTAALGDALSAVVVFGSAAGPEHHAAHSDVNVLVLLSRLGTVELSPALADVVRDWAAAGQPAPLMMTVAEWRRSADIFPMEVGDVLARHQVLVGSAPFEGMVVARRDLRLQLEQEAMGKLLRLRGAILTTGGDHERQRQLLARSFSTFMVLFRAVERLAGATVPAGNEALVAAVAGRVGFDGRPFVDVARFRAGGAPPAEPAGLLAGYLAGAEKLAAFLDVFPAGE